MIKDWLQSVGRWCLAFCTVITGAALLWRGHAFNDPHGAGLTVPLMCAVTALLLTLTGLAAVSRCEEEDFQA